MSGGTSKAAGSARRSAVTKRPADPASRPALRGAYTWLVGRPALAAALVYAVLSVALFAPGMVPGRTLSASDYIWWSAPWESEVPAGIPVLGSNRSMGDAAVVFHPFLEATRRDCRTCRSGTRTSWADGPFVGNAQSAVFSPFSVPSYVLPFWDSLAFAAALKLFVAAFGDVSAGAGARDALRRGAAGRAGVRLRPLTSSGSPGRS